MAKILFCNNFLEPKKIDPDFEKEYTSAKNAGLDCLLVSHEELTLNEPLKSISKLPAEDQEIATIYRGWMLTPKEYTRLYDKLLTKKIKLINSPDKYKHVHYLPESYNLIKEQSPKTVSIPVGDNFYFEDVFDKLLTFGKSSLIIKDYVKSEKHYWKEACFIEDASDKSNVKSVTERFLELRGSSLNKGLVYREFVDLEYLGNHAKSGMPLTKEYRLFWLFGKCIAAFQYWDEAEYQNLLPPTQKFKEVALKIKSNFFTMDIAQKTNGDWIIIELGDGQVSGLPDNADLNEFYSSLINASR